MAAPQTQWLKSKAAPWDHGLLLDMPLPSICFINCLCSAFFSLYCPPLLTQSTGCYKGDLVLVPRKASSHSQRLSFPFL